ncbi:MarR family transcriptional regulator [Muricoccus aerilatus]|uniref:MarR family transcriptional regulator n=1 Tax=Muricoccus aerilatus TaxID=452982 RepID=UPI0005C1C8B6
MVQGAPSQFIEILRETIVSLVRRDGPDLTARQLSIFLIVYLDEGPHTVRGLASALNVPKASVTRGLDRLSKFELTRRKTDPQDRRSVLVQRTVKGTALAREITAVMGEAAAAMEEKRSSRKEYAVSHTH